MSEDRVAVAVIGGGPAGLSAAAALGHAGVGPVLVLERERTAGGIPRHCGHQGFGLTDLRRALSGPAYARRLTERALQAGATVALHTQVTGWTADGGLALTSPEGLRTLRADAIVLATGCRERPRSARLIPGTRPQGVMTTGTLQQLVHLEHEPVGRRAVIVGAEHVSFSALATLARAGTDTVAMITEAPHHESFAAFALGAAVRHRVHVRTRTALGAIHGSPRVQAVTLVDLDSGAASEVECDLVVLTADWIPDHELAVTGGAQLVDCAGRTSRRGLFAAGNVLHGAEPADVAARGGRAVAQSVLDHLGGGGDWPQRRIGIEAAAPLGWIVPGAVGVDAGGRVQRAPAQPFRARAGDVVRGAVLEIAQGDRVLDRSRHRQLSPGRSVTLDGGWVARVDPDGTGIRVRIAAARRR
jgi:thioredoxin reductase